MADLIDRKQLINGHVYSTRSGKLNYEKMFKNLVNDIINAPTVDIERHARWVIRFESIYQKYVEGKCSNCGHTDYCLDEKGFYNYCPNCGAKMDKVEDETQKFQQFVDEEKNSPIITKEQFDAVVNRIFKLLR